MACRCGVTKEKKSSKTGGTAVICQGKVLGKISKPIMRIKKLAFRGKIQSELRGKSGRIESRGKKSKGGGNFLGPMSLPRPRLLAGWLLNKMNLSEKTVSGGNGDTSAHRMKRLGFVLWVGGGARYFSLSKTETWNAKPWENKMKLNSIYANDINCFI